MYGQDSMIAVSPLSPSECRTLALLGAGLSFKEIALNMGVSYDCAKMYAKRSYRKLGVHDWYSAVRKHKRLPVHRCTQLLPTPRETQD